MDEDDGLNLDDSDEDDGLGPDDEELEYWKERARESQEENRRLRMDALADKRDQRRSNWLLGIGIAVLVASAVYFDGHGYQGGVSDGMTWQLDYSLGMSTCSDANMNDAVAHVRQKYPGMPLVDAQIQAEESYGAATTYICQKYVTAKLGEPPKALGWSDAPTYGEGKVVPPPGASPTATPK
jgi:hypothetical protein